MLFFQGDAFAYSLLLYEKYRFFLNPDSNVAPFASLSFTDQPRQIVIPADQALIKVHNFFLAPVNNSNFSYFIKCADCRLVTRGHFSQIGISSGYMCKLSESSYLHLNEGIYQLARFRALFLDMLVLHASAVVYRDEVILFSGVSGAGKSTQARLWVENTDAWVLNYDKPVIGLSGERAMVSGSPWGGKEDLAINEVRPAKALFFVHQAKENRVVRLSAAKAYAQAHLNYFVYPLNEDIERRYNDAIIRLIQMVPAYDLYCTDTKEAVEAVKRELYP